MLLVFFIFGLCVYLYIRLVLEMVDDMRRRR